MKEKLPIIYFVSRLWVASFNLRNDEACTVQVTFLIGITNLSPCLIFPTFNLRTFWIW
jgi:hypothetical protein